MLKDASCISYFLAQNFIVGWNCYWFWSWRKPFLSSCAALLGGHFVTLTLCIPCHILESRCDGTLNDSYWSHRTSRPFRNYPWPLFQSESWCSFFHMKITFHLHVNENLFSYVSWAQGFALKKRSKVIRKYGILLAIWIEPAPFIRKISAPALAFWRWLCRHAS